MPHNLPGDLNGPQEPQEAPQRDHLLELGIMFWYGLMVGVFLTLTVQLVWPGCS